ncbi:MAG: glycosyltransferase family 2 protein [Flavobacteriaceae bacterium]
MKVAGFTIIRNAIQYDFPVVESISSILSICDEFVVAVGKSDDDTLNLIKSIDSNKIKIIETVWDDSLKGEQGVVFAKETDKAFKAISPEMDWAFYIQSDELVHEKYLPTIQQAMKAWKDDKSVDGLLFKYKHFYGNYNYYGASYKWYRNEIRIVKNTTTIYSYKDAQSFRKDENQKLNVKLIDAEIYHYGYVREPKKLAKKIEVQHSFHDKTILEMEEFIYEDNVSALYEFKGTHPLVIKDRIERMNWDFDVKKIQNRLSLKDIFKKTIEKITGGYIVGAFRNYKLLK